MGEEEIDFVTRIQDLSSTKLLFWLNYFIVQFMLCIAEALLYIPQRIKKTGYFFWINRRNLPPNPCCTNVLSVLLSSVTRNVYYVLVESRLMSVKNMKLTLHELCFTCLVHSGTNTETHFFVLTSCQNFGAIPVLPLVFSFPLKLSLKELWWTFQFCHVLLCKKYCLFHLQ